MASRKFPNSNTYHHVLQKTQDKIQELEKAIAKINSSMIFLKHNTTEVKASISSVFRHHLEALRGRECQLLSQIDAIQHEKEAKLRIQKDRLCSLHGGLLASLSYSKEDEKEPIVLAKHLSMSLERLDKLDLRPQETPHFGFHADIKSFQNCVESFGSVTAVTPVLNSAFVSPLSNSSSLPRTFEDYGDMEHLVLYKTLEDVNMEDQINVHIPKLCGGSPVGLDLTPSSATKFVFPSPSASELSNIMSNHCVDNWLVQIKNDTEIEEDCDFEVLSCGRTNDGSNLSIEIIPMDDCSQCTDLFPHFDETFSSPDENWLINSNDDDDFTESMEEQNYNNILIEMENIRVSSNIKENEMSEIEDKDKTKNPSNNSKECSLNGTCNDNGAERYDIENLDMLICLNNDKVRWLVTSPSSDKLQCNTEKMEKDIDEKENDSISTCCRANEVCSSFDECLMDENCCNYTTNLNEDYLSDRFDYPSEFSEDSLQDIMKHFDDIENSGNTEWLTKDLSKSEKENIEKSDISDPDLWISTPKRKKLEEKSVYTDDVFSTYDLESEKKKWLITDEIEKSDSKTSLQFMDHLKNESIWLAYKGGISKSILDEIDDPSALFKNQLLNKWLHCH